MSEHTIRWTLQKATSRLTLLQPLLFQKRHSIGNYALKLLAGPQADAPVQPGVSTDDWLSVAPPAQFAEWRTDFCLRTPFTIPTDWQPDEGNFVLVCHLNRPGSVASPEAMAYIDGTPVCGIDRFHDEIPLSAALQDGQSHLLALHGWTSFSEHTIEPLPELQPAFVAQEHPLMRRFLALYRMALGTASSLEDSSPIRAGLLNALNEALSELDFQEPIDARFYATLPDALAALEYGISITGPALPGVVDAAGHAHIDIAWLWTLGQTHRKAAHTFHTVLSLMQDFPEFSYSQSQPQLYDFIREDNPTLFASIQQQVQAGHWEPMGGMWVEADCNLSGAESLARQFLLGRTFFEQHFGAGADSPVLWLPDVFGYCWSLPQLIHEAGLAYFFTIKIGWNQYNHLPWDSFYWQGLDGTRVLTHCSPTPDLAGYGASTYNAEAQPVQILGSRTQFKQQELTNTPVLMSFGYGDGGGGPTREMIENITIAANFPGLPHTRFSKVKDFFGELQRTSADRLPVWDGELYFEYHRGTYTSQSRLKRANRKSEYLLHDTEFLWAWAKALNPSLEIPKDTLDAAWRLVCLNQFHDILPGSSIGPVYAEALSQHEHVRTSVEPLRDQALALISDSLNADLVVVNPTSFIRSEVVFCPDLPPNTSYVSMDGATALTQAAEGGAWLLPPAEVPAYGALGLRATNMPLIAEVPDLFATPDLLENDWLRVEFDPSGEITRILDKQAGREVLASGAQGNLLQAYEDRPLYWDAWDLDIYYDDKPLHMPAADSIRVVECGPLTAAMEITRPFGNSRITQRIRLWKGSARLDFETTVDWHERHTLLKVAFPVDILAPTATYDIQWGSVQRPTHRNTSWDWARFESCAHKWVDLSEGDYGVSLLNDCKYGHDILGQTIRLTLLRSPTSPDPQADQGIHHFTYSLLPHRGGYEQAIPAAYALNDPLMVWRSQASSLDAPADQACLLHLQPANLVIETIKPAEDGRGFIVRLYDSGRQRGTGKLTSTIPLLAAYQTNLLEVDQAALPLQDSTLLFRFKPFQILTLRLIPLS